MNGNLTFYLKNYSDLNTYEFLISFILIFLILFLGIMPNYILEILTANHYLILERIKY